MSEKVTKPVILAWPEASAPARLPKHVYTLKGPKLSRGDWPNSLGECEARHVLNAAKALNEHVERLSNDYGCLPNQVLCVPGSEWATLATGLANNYRKADGVNLETAITCTDRRTQRERLEPTGLNPKWAVDGIEGLSSFPVVVKAPVSTFSRGVAMARDLPDVSNAVKQVSTNMAFMRSRLTMVTQVSYFYLVEEHIDGQLFEVSGVVDSKNVMYFRPLSISCSEDKKIVGFAPAAEASHELAYDLAANVVRTLGLRWCFFMIEFKLREGRPCLIEVQCRLGTATPDDKYFGFISPGAHPVEKGMEFLLEKWNL